MKRTLALSLTNSELLNEPKLGHYLELSSACLPEVTLGLTLAKFPQPLVTATLFFRYQNWLQVHILEQLNLPKTNLLLTSLDIHVTSIHFT